MVRPAGLFAGFNYPNQYECSEEGTLRSPKSLNDSMFGRVVIAAKAPKEPRVGRRDAQAGKPERF